LYKLNSAKTLGSPETLTLSQGSATIAVTDTAEGKTISIQSDVDSYERNYQMNLNRGSGMSFSYGMQAGLGGLEMINNSTVYGNVFVNGDITGSNNALITETAIAANVSDPITSTSNNNGTMDPPVAINFGGNSASTPQDIAQSFTISTTTPVSAVRILIKKTGAPSNFTVQIKDNVGGSPGTTTRASIIVSAATVTSTYGYLTLPFSSTWTPTIGTTYWLVLDGANYTGNKYYTVGANDSTYSGGVAKISTGGTTWGAATPATNDLYFDVYVGGDTGLITGVTVRKDAWANTVTNSSITGLLHCQTGSNNGGKNCDTSWADPIQKSWPISDGNIAEWKSQAEAGTATTSIAISSGSMTFGPGTVTGDVAVTGSGVLKLRGTVYVHGNITVSGNSAQVRVDPSLGTNGTIIVVDGRVETSNGGQLTGSGTSGSFIMVVSTNTCPSGSGCNLHNAIEIGNNSGTVILNAQSGTIQFTNNSTASQVTANKILLTNNASVTYESGLQDPNFTTGPSGSWAIDSWKEVE
jgi:hypothetical protein